MPQVIEKKVPYTYLVPKLVTTTVEKEVIDYLPKAEEREIKYPVCRLEFKSVIEEARKRLGASGRLVIRPSGTEPLIRVMAEGDDQGLVESVVDTIVQAISDARSAA